MQHHGYFKKLDFVFYNEQRIRQAVDDERSDRGEIVGRNRSGVGDPTATKAIRNLTPLRMVRIGDVSLEWPEHWLDVIRRTRDWAPRDCLIVGTDFYACTDRSITMSKLTISQAAYYRLLDDYKNHAAMVAVQLGLIKVF